MYLCDIQLYPKSALNKSNNRNKENNRLTRTDRTDITARPGKRPRFHLIKPKLRALLCTLCIPKLPIT